MSKYIAVNCGHGVSLDGSWDSGCTYGKYSEAALMLKITKAAVKRLRAAGVEVLSDADHNNNKNMIVDVRDANREGVDMYISIHCDYLKAPSGVMPLYVSGSGKRLGKCLEKQIKKQMRIRSRGVCKRTDLWELNGTDMPAVILETGAIKADLKTLRDRPIEYGHAVADGIMDYLGVHPPSANVKKTDQLYRVRKSWKDTKSQKGAYKVLTSAKECADKYGYTVYDKGGKAVYHGKKD